LDAASGADPTSQKISFLGCWDEKKGENWKEKAHSCASTTSLDFDKISACASGGAGDDLQKIAAEAWSKNFPKRPCGGIFGVPHIEINREVQANPPTYKGLLENLCATGIEAAACKAVVVIL